MRGALSTLLAAILLSSCTGDGSGAGEDDGRRIDPAGTSTPTDDDTRYAIPVPGVPPSGVPGTAEQARRFGRYFLVEQVGYLVNAGYPSDYLRTTATACTTCREFSDQMAEWHAEGPITMAPVEVRVVEVQPVESDTFHALHFLAFDTVVPPVRRGDQVLQPGASGEQLLAVYVDRGHWKVGEWTQLGQSTDEF